MELACYLKRMSVRAVVEWAPREINKGTDSLANGHTEQFVPNLRFHVYPAQLHKHVGAYPDRARPQKRRKPEHKLRATDPW